MRVLSLLGTYQFGHLRRAVPESWVVRSLGLTGVLEGLAVGGGGAVVVDPADIETGAFEALIAGAAKAGARMVLCGEALDIGPRRLVETVGALHVEILAASVGDSAAQLTSLISLQAPSVPSRVLRAVGERFLRLPSRAARNAVRLFTFAPLPGSVEEMCDYVGRHQTTLGRYHQRVGLCNPSTLLTMAGLARVAHHAALGEHDDTRVAALSGFGNVRALNLAVKRQFGVTYLSLARVGVPSNAAEGLSAQILLDPKAAA